MDDRVVGAPSPTTAAKELRHWLLLAGPVAVLLAVALAMADFNEPRASSLVVLLVVLPLLARDQWPLPVLAVVAAGATITAGAVSEPWVQIAAVIVASAAVGAAGTDRISSLLAVLLVAALMAVGILAQDADVFEAIVLPFAIIVPPWLIGDVVRTRRVEAERRAEEAELAMRAREERLRAAIVEERRHVAR